MLNVISVCVSAIVIYVKCDFCVCFSNGRAIHYNGSSLLQWKSVRLDLGLSTGDIAGIGWERQGDAAPLPGHTVRGLVYFTYNGRKLTATLDDVAGGMWPVVHIQKKVRLAGNAKTAK